MCACAERQGYKCTLSLPAPPTPTRPARPPSRSPTGDATATIRFYSPGIRPAWDSNQLDIASVQPCASAAYRLLTVNGGSESNREVIK